MRGFRIPTLAALAVVLLTLAACGDEDGSGSSPGGQAESGGAATSGLQHVHGLGVNPADGSLIIATHTGLYRAPRGSTKAAAYGTSRQDVMGFSVQGPNRFLGSGHPAPGQSLPPLLGLIESRNGGRSWTSISLLGQADFHVLRSQGSQVYGLNSATGTLMVSRDAGRSWKTIRPPGGLVDLAVDPSDPNRVIASTEQGLLESQNEGRAWRPLTLRDAPLGLLAWPRGDQPYLVDGQGRVYRGENRGREWRQTGGSIGGQPAAFATAGDDLYAALHDGTITVSNDKGRSWAVRAAP
jgi:hypothetical protein